MPTAAQRQPLAKHHAQHAAFARADGHADTDLARALADRVGDHRVEAEHAEREADHADRGNHLRHQSHPPQRLLLED